MFQLLAAFAVVTVDDQSEAVPDNHDVLVSDRNVLPLRKVFNLFVLVFCILLDNETQILGCFLRSLGRRDVMSWHFGCAFRFDLVCCSGFFLSLIIHLGALEVDEGVR